MSVTKRCWFIERVVGTKVTLLGTASDKALTSHTFADVIIGVDNGAGTTNGPTLTLTVDGHLFFDKLNVAAAMGAHAAAVDPALAPLLKANANSAAAVTEAHESGEGFFDGPQGLSIKASKAVVKNWILQPWDDRPQPVPRFAFDPRQAPPPASSAYGLPPTQQSRASAFPPLSQQGVNAADSEVMSVGKIQPAVGLPQLAQGQPRRLNTGSSEGAQRSDRGDPYAPHGRGSSAPQVLFWNTCSHSHQFRLLPLITGWACVL